MVGATPGEGQRDRGRAAALRVPPWLQPPGLDPQGHGAVLRWLSDRALADSRPCDLLTSTLALVAAMALKNKWSSATPRFWVFNLVGFAYLLTAVPQFVSRQLDKQDLGFIWLMFVRPVDGTPLVSCPPRTGRRLCFECWRLSPRSGICIGSRTDAWGSRAPSRWPAPQTVSERETVTWPPNGFPWAIGCATVAPSQSSRSDWANKRSRHVTRLCRHHLHPVRQGGAAS